MRYFKILIVFSIILSCKKVKVSKVDLSTQTSEINLLISDVNKTGNIDSYELLKGYLYLNGDYPTLLVVSKNMFEKYNYSNAAYEVYYSYFKIKNNDSITENEINEAIEYLIKASKNGYERAKLQLENYNSKGLYVEKNNNTYVLKKKK